MEMSLKQLLNSQNFVLVPAFNRGASIVAASKTEIHNLSKFKICVGVLGLMALQGSENIEEVGMGGTKVRANNKGLCCKKDISWAHVHFTNELPEAVVASIRPAYGCVYQHFLIERKGLMALCHCWRRCIIFFSGVVDER